MDAGELLPAIQIEAHFDAMYFKSGFHFVAHLLLGCCEYSGPRQAAPAILHFVPCSLITRSAAPFTTLSLRWRSDIETRSAPKWF
jgi:hypothetical protein